MKYIHYHTLNFAVKQDCDRTVALFVENYLSYQNAVTFIVIDVWVGRTRGQLDFYQRQMLTGHGCFNSYLHRIGNVEQPACSSCGVALDDAEHTVFKCDRWWSERRRLDVRLEGLDPETVVQKMLVSQENWEAVRGFVTAVLIKKEEEERRMQAATEARPVN